MCTLCVQMKFVYMYARVWAVDIPKYSTWVSKVQGVTVSLSTHTHTHTHNHNLLTIHPCVCMCENSSIHTEALLQINLLNFLNLLYSLYNPHPLCLVVYDTCVSQKL